jgi:hypothetical protein
MVGDFACRTATCDDESVSRLPIVHRRPSARSRPAIWLSPLIVLALTLGACGGSGSSGDTEQVTTTAAVNTGQPDEDFMPAENDLSQCIGLVERPGCGNERRVDGMMLVTFGVLILGLTFIGWRIVRTIRRAQRLDTT